MPSLALRVTARYKQAVAIRHATAEAHSDHLWQGAVKALRDFQDAIKRAEALDLTSLDPNDPASYDTKEIRDLIFLPTPLAISAVEEFLQWFRVAFGYNAENDLEMHRPKGAVVTERDNLVDGWNAFLAQLKVYEAKVQGYLDQIAPASFTYHGFHVDNPQRIGSDRALKMLDGVPFLLALFKKRGVEPLLHKGVKNIALNENLGGDNWHGYCAYRDREIGLSTKMLYADASRLWSTWIQEVFLHEFGHYVHGVYVTGEAKDFWNQTWDPIKTIRKSLERISQAEILRFYSLLEKDGFVPGKTAKRLKGVDKVKFAYWLRNPLWGQPLITPKQFRLTKDGEGIFDILRDPHKWYTEHEGEVYYAGDTEEERMAKVVKSKKEILLLDYSSGMGISPKEVENLRKADPAIDQALEQEYQALGVPSEYGKTNENEDFAESFVLLMTAPQRLSENALYRMKHTLWLSGFGGKPVMRLAARPVPVDKRELQNFVQNFLVPDIQRWLTNRPEREQDEPIGRVSDIALGFLEVEEADGKGTHTARVEVHSISAKGKHATVLRGVSRENTIELYLNGAFSPRELSKSEGYPAPMQPLWSCKHIACLPYGLYSTLLHEVTHNAEKIFKPKLTYSPSKVLERDDDETMRVYLNDPGEVRAHMQQVVDEVLRSAEHQSIRDHASKKPNPNRAFVDILLRMSTTWGLIEKLLTPRNRALTLKAVYDGLDRGDLLLNGKQASMRLVAARYKPVPEDKEILEAMSKDFIGRSHYHEWMTWVDESGFFSAVENNDEYTDSNDESYYVLTLNDVLQGYPRNVQNHASRLMAQFRKNQSFEKDWYKAVAAKAGYYKTAAERVAARYKQKKVVDSEKGGKTTVYMYSERQIARRNAEKAKRLEKLSKGIGELRKKIKRDIKSSDPEKCLTALAVALIDHTFERVGNEDSVKERKHYGVTGWRRSHVSFGRGTATIKYTGKSGVQQTKKVTDKAILTALRNAYEAAEDDEAGLFEHSTGKVTAAKVNAYLEPFNITAKDIRGLHANAEMQTRLKAIRAKAGALPEDKKERKAQLKEEFKKALEETAEAVGHEASTLRSQYLVPGLESEYLKDGNVESTFVKTAAWPFYYDVDLSEPEPLAERTAHRWLQATR